jgi:hypothetical protein
LTVAASHARQFDPDLFAEISRIVYDETRDALRKLHLVRGALGCDASIRVGRGFRVSGGCPCVDEFVDAVVEVWRYLGEHDPAAVRSYGALARTHCRLRVIKDLNRRRRGRRTQQRTDRLENGPIGQTLSTPAQRALLRHLVDEAASAAPLDGEAQLIRRLAVLRAAEFGGTEDEHLAQVARDLRVVRDTAISHGRRQRDSAGTLVSWWEYYVDTGLGRRERLSIADYQEAEIPDRHQDGIVVRSVVAAATTGNAGVRAALLELAFRGVLDMSVARRLVDDDAQLAEITTSARLLADRVA